MLVDIVDAQLQFSMSLVITNGATHLRDSLMDGNNSGLHAGVDASLASDALRLRRPFFFLRVPSLTNGPASPEEAGPRSDDSSSRIIISSVSPTAVSDHEPPEPTTEEVSQGR